MAQCTDCDARIEYKGNGSQRTFTFPFEYLESTDVKVAQYDKENFEYVNLTYGTDWKLKNPTVVELTTAPSTNIVIYRCTDIDQMQATFFPGYSVKADDLNIDFNQLRLAVEEGRCTSGNIIEKLEESKELFLNRINVDEIKEGYKGDLVKSNSDLTINDEVVATTQWIDNRYWDQCEETTYLEDTWVNEIDDAHIPTTGAVEGRLVEIIRNGGFGLPSVVSVNGKAGVVSLGLGDLTDVETSSAGHIPTNGQALVWNSGMNHWMPETISSGGVPEAPSDGRQYGRQNDSWTEIISTGGGGGDSGLWQQSGATLEPVDGADNLAVDGSATFGGTVNAARVYTNIDSNSSAFRVNDTTTNKQTFDITGSGQVSIGPNLIDPPNISLIPDGSATFAGNLTANGYALAQLPALPA